MASRAPHDAAGTSLRLDGMPGPRWNRQSPIYPSHVHTWLDCPRRCRLQYVDRVPFEQQWNRKIEVGNALHKVMEEVANLLRQRRSLPPIGHWRPRIERLLPATHYEAAGDLTLADRAADIENVLLWVERAQSYITDRTATVIRIEKYYPREWADPALGPMKLSAKADLVMRRQGERGPYIEIIDYKTGRWQRPIDFAPVLTRISHKPQIHAALREHGFPRVVFSYLWLAQDRVQATEMTRDHTTNQWRELHRVLTRMLGEEHWPMHPHPRVCPHCPYFGTRCTPMMPDS